MWLCYMAVLIWHFDKQVNGKSMKNKYNNLLTDTQYTDVDCDIKNIKEVMKGLNFVGN